MPRNSVGTYTLPQAPFVPGTTISSAAVNSNFSDIANALTGSLPRDGSAGMTGPFKLPDGSTTNPALSFINETNTGFSRSGVGQLAVDIQGVQVGAFTSAGWNGPITAINIPIGIIIDYAGLLTSIPAKWLLCDGTAYSRTTYSALFANISTLWGAGDGSTTFNVPDLRGRCVFGIDPGTGRLTSTYWGGNPANVSYGGVQSIAEAVGNMPAHRHAAAIHDPNHTHSASGGPFLSWASSIGLDHALGGAASFQNVTISTNPSYTSIQAFDGTANYTDVAGSGTAMSNLPPGATMLKLIFAGV